jgi:DNA mismatch repair protein MSH6
MGVICCCDVVLSSVCCCISSRSPSLVLYYCFCAGKFYEIFHMDADAAVQVCDGDLNYMKGIVAHCGFPEISYGQFSNRLVSAGYKVARVEQTETPAQLAERKRTHRGSGPKPKVVNREVCSILTRGTRTFCYLDDNRELEEEGGSGTGPLLAIREVLIDAGDGAPTNEDDEVKPVCEYGVTIVDAVRGSVTIGQFADDILRSRMTTLFMAFEPSEVSCWASLII